MRMIRIAVALLAACPLAAQQHGVQVGGMDKNVRQLLRLRQSRDERTPDSRTTFVSRSAHLSDKNRWCALEP